MKKGLHIGIGNGLAINGIHKGIGNGLRGITPSTTSKNINPSTLVGNKKPLIFWNAESTINTGYNSNISSVSNINGTQSLIINSDPFYIYNPQTNRGAIQFDSNDTIYASANGLFNLKEATVFIVCNIDSTSTYNVVWAIDSVALDTIGDFKIEAINGNTIRSTLYGNPTTNISQFDSFLPEVEYNTFLICAKYKLGDTSGQPSHELHINGIKNMKVVTNTFTTTTSDSFANSPIHFGANSSLVSGGGTTLSALLLPYWVNESEQFLIENYFRNYYGFQF